MTVTFGDPEADEGTVDIRFVRSVLLRRGRAPTKGSWGRADPGEYPELLVSGEFRAIGVRYDNRESYSDNLDLALRDYERVLAALRATSHA